MKAVSLIRASLLLFPPIVFTSCSEEDQPTGELQLGKVDAFYTKIHSGEEFENYSRTGEYADILVDLGDGSSKLVFWRGSSYLPYLETDEGNHESNY